MAEREILVRLRLGAEDFSRRITEAFGGVIPQAEKAGADSASGMAKGFNSGKSAFISAVGSAAKEAGIAVGGLDKLALANSRVEQSTVGLARAQAQAKANTAAWRAELVAGRLTQEEFNASIIRQGQALAGLRQEYRANVTAAKGLANSQAGVTQVSGQTRFAMQNLGFQVNDVATQFALGQAPMRIFAAQAGQVVQSVSLLAGGTGKLAQFLGGPWGIAMTGAAIVMGSLLLSTEDETEAIDDLSQALGVAGLNADQLRQQNELLSDSLREVEQTALQAAVALQKQIATDLSVKRAERDALVRERDRFIVQKASPNALDRARGFAGARDFDQERLNELNSVLGKLPPAFRQAQAEQIKLTANMDEAASVAEDYDARIATLIDQFVRFGHGDAPTLTAAVERLTTQKEAAVKAAKDLAKETGNAGRKVRETTSDMDKFLQSLARGEDRLGLARRAFEDGKISARQFGDEVRKAEAALSSFAKVPVSEIGILGPARRGQDPDSIAVFDDAAEKLADASVKIDKEALERGKDNLQELAALYEDLFTGGVDRVWDHFKDEGLRVIADVAGQLTLALLSGKGSTDLQGALAGALGRSPLGTLFGAANDNPARAGSSPASDAAVAAGQLATQRARVGGSGGFGAGDAQPGAAPATSLLDQQGIALVAGVAINSILGGGKTAQIGGALGGIAGSALGGPVGAAIGTAIGNLLGGALSGTPKGTATLGGSGSSFGITGTAGKSALVGQATGLASSIEDAITQIAEALGADVGSGSVSIGLRGDNLRVDPSGSGQTKKKKGAIDFGGDTEAAVAFAIRNLIEDGVITGISQASQNILKKGGDLEAAIEKAVLIESVPRLLRERFDPLGAALDAVFDKFTKLAAALREGGASAEQIAEARKLFELERADTIAAIGEASKGLKDFLLTLNAGSESPLSLRQQRAAAQGQLDPFLAQIDAAEAAREEVDRLRAAGASASEIEAAEQAARIASGKIDQQGFTQASQLLLGIIRQSDASGAGFFSDFDRIRALTGQAISLVDGSQSAVDNRDPFAELTAQNTTDIANILSDHSNLLHAINDNLSSLSRDTVTGGFLLQQRAFT